MTLTGDFAEKIWVPDTFFANDKHSFLHDVTEKNKMVRLHGDGHIAYGMRYVTNSHSTVVTAKLYPIFMLPRVWFVVHKLWLNCTQGMVWCT